MRSARELQQMGHFNPESINPDVQPDVTNGTVDVNWRWRLLPGQLTGELGEEILIFTKRFGRANWGALNAMEKAAKADSGENLE